MKILLTGGAGYIGSHTTVELIQAGHSVVVVDNLSNSSEDVIKRVERITGTEIPFYKLDLRDDLSTVFNGHVFDACIHFAGLKAVGESVSLPLRYYDNNLVSTLNLIKTLEAHNCKNIIFSSSATVYGTSAEIPITENCPKGTCTNPYGWTKWMIEQILTDLHIADSSWNIVILRYFNPVGAHQSGLIGESPKGIPNNLMPYITQVASGRLEKLHIFGNDYETPDGTGIRDYIHVVDLARGHVAALTALGLQNEENEAKEANEARATNSEGLVIYNLGTGCGYSVLDMVHTFERVNGVRVPYVIEDRRAGDIGVCYSDSSKAMRELHWKAEYGLEEMCRDSWNWEQNQD
ncbi:MAG: UDP-glucose 4-epimerase GalE [Synergistaceae bacterium]|nr:UDP-glucose 4-epimerase GalE [Synergistaceae bacterium]